MKHKPVPSHTWSFPSVRFPFSLFEEGEEERLRHFHESSGLAISEDAKCIYVEAAVPGIKSDEIEMTFENGVLWIKAEKKEETEDKKKRFYRKAMNTFSYRIAIPTDVDETKHPEALCKNGVLKVTFLKKKKKDSKRISIKSG